MFVTYVCEVKIIPKLCTFGKENHSITYVLEGRLYRIYSLTSGYPLIAWFWSNKISKNIVFNNNVCNIYLPYPLFDFD